MKYLRIVETKAEYDKIVSENPNTPLVCHVNEDDKPSFYNYYEVFLSADLDFEAADGKFLTLKD